MTCNVCKGTGRVKKGFFTKKRCDNCDGSGRVSTDHVKSFTTSERSRRENVDDVDFGSSLYHHHVIASSVSYEPSHSHSDSHSYDSGSSSSCDSGGSSSGGGGGCDGGGGGGD